MQRLLFLCVSALNQPRLGFSYVLPILWDPGGVSNVLGCFPTDLEHLLPLDTHTQHVCIT